MDIFPVQKNRTILASIVAAVVIIGIAAMPTMLRITSTPEFCGLCHVMAFQYEEWFHSGMHQQISCVDCHLPNNNIAEHLVWKGIDGTKDVLYFYSRLTPERIQASSHARKTIQDNCVRCHQGMIMRISTDGMRCWDCHRGIYHRVMQ